MDNLIFRGSTVKVYVNLEPMGSYSMKDFSFEVDVYTEMSPKVLTFKKEDAHMVDDDTYFVIVDTNELDYGNLKVRVRAKVPDSETNGMRPEVIVFSLGKRVVKSM